MTTPDYRALCAELADIVKAHASPDNDAVGYVAAVLTSARAALAELEPPVDGEAAELVAELIQTANFLDDDWYHGSARVTRRAADLLSRLAPQPVPEGPSDGPAVPESREPASVVGDPSDEELLKLMPQQFRDDLATVSRLAAQGTSPDVTPGIFRVSLNTGALDYARAVLARWGVTNNKNE